LTVHILLQLLRARIWEPKMRHDLGQKKEQQTINLHYHKVLQKDSEVFFKKIVKSSPHGVEDIDTKNHAVVLNHIQYFVTEVSMLNEPILQCCNPVFLYPVKYVKSTNRPSIPLLCTINTFPASTLVAETTIYMSRKRSMTFKLKYLVTWHKFWNILRKGAACFLQIGHSARCVRRRWRGHRMDSKLQRGWKQQQQWPPCHAKSCIHTSVIKQFWWGGQEAYSYLIGSGAQDCGDLLYSQFSQLLELIYIPMATVNLTMKGTARWM